jgi:hypothetical protein
MVPSVSTIQPREPFYADLALRLDSSRTIVMAQYQTKRPATCNCYVLSILYGPNGLSVEHSDPRNYWPKDEVASNVASPSSYAV